MDTVPTFYRVKPIFVQGKDGIINYFRYVDMATKKKMYQPIIGRKALSRMFRRRTDAYKYGMNVLNRYQRLLKAMKPTEEVSEDGV